MINFFTTNFNIKKMNERELKELLSELLKKDESDSYIEFKADIEPCLVGEHISALSNSACLKHTDFGYLVLGIEDKTKKIVGTKFNIKTADQVCYHMFDQL